MKIMIIKYIGRAGPYVMDDFMTSLNDLGHETRVIDLRNPDSPNTRRTSQEMFDDIKKTLREFLPDFIMGYGTTNLFTVKVGTSSQVDIFTRLGIPSVSIFYDSPTDYRLFDGLHNAFHPDYHYFFIWDKHYTEEMKKLGHEKSYYFPIATNTRRFKKLPFNEADAEKYGADVSFVGSYTVKREVILSRLLDNFNLTIWGYDWERAGDKRFAPLVRGVADNMKELVKVYNYSKVNINITVDQGISSLNMRVFDCLASGGFLISDHKADFDTLFDGKNEAVTFREAKELPQLVRYYLDHEKERKEIAKNGRRRVLAEHSYHKRVEQMLETLEKEGAFAPPHWVKKWGDPAKALDAMVEMFNQYTREQAGKMAARADLQPERPQENQSDDHQPGAGIRFGVPAEREEAAV